ncbi:unnamed protein product [Prorocentrum cordatum]|uniref:PPPDE domain-containing protein n=2 Tax=Prorocentrum cordatum TaxID=2364126 RepID=A0ABN9W2S8_9DINO|nr:unnamed protein product [Polarella glacialis]
MGESPLGEEEIRNVLAEAMDTWPANSYHPICRNCVTFAEDRLVRLLRAPGPFPAWARGAAEAAKGPVLLAMADAAWEWVKWYVAEPPDVDELPAEDPHGPRRARAADPLC